MNLKSYLNRIHYFKDPKVNIQSLFEIQTNQLLHIPFENLDCFNNLPISINLKNIEEKILDRKRGGYCFELNILFLEVIKEIGFKARPLLCRSMWRGNTINSKTHIAILVEVENKSYICDVGFGGPGFFSPLMFEVNQEFEQAIGTFKFVTDEVHGFILQKKINDSWLNVYAFNLDHVFENDLIMSNYYTSNFEESFFRKNLVASLFSENGRKTLMNKTFSRVVSGIVQTKELENEEEVWRILEEEFSIYN
jgi:N-hydroxyarylamine O-acetyltransferase